MVPGTCLGNTREAGFKEKIIGSIRHVEFDGAYTGFAWQMLTVGVWIDGSVVQENSLIGIESLGVISWEV